MTPAAATLDPGPARAAMGPVRVALLGNPNTGKTTLFNRLSGLRHKTSNFPGTTQEARVGFVRASEASGAPAIELIDLPGIYSLELDQGEAEICRRVLAGTLAPPGHAVAAPDAVLIVVDATNLGRNLALVGEALRRRLPTVIALNMTDLARRRGLHLDAGVLMDRLGCVVVPCCARSGEGVESLRAAITDARISNRTPPGTQEGLEAWAEETYEAAALAPPGALRPARPVTDLTDRLDRVFTHPVLGLVCFAAVMFGLFWSIFALAAYPMEWIDGLFSLGAEGVRAFMPEGVLREFLAGGVVGGVGATVIFLPQIALLSFLISVLEDTGYLARAAFVTNRALRPFGLSGHAFVPLLSSHACALPGIMATRAIPDRRERLAAILSAPFMSCTARIPVYVLLTVILFPGSPLRQAVAFTACYLLGIAAGLLSALIARRTILRGPGRPMALELPTYKLPSLRTAALAASDRSLIFLKKAGTNILAIAVVLWWLSSFPQGQPPAAALDLRAQAAALFATDVPAAEALTAEADAIASAAQGRQSFAARLGRFAQPVFAPLGYDWQLTVGVLTSFAAREVFVTTMGVIVAGTGDLEGEGVLDAIAAAKRDDGVTPIFTPATSWSLLVYFVLAMQCLPTLAVTAREAGGARWAFLQLGWMAGLAYGAALLTYQGLRAMGVA